MGNRISRRESAALINSLSSGVVPRIGLRHVAVGRRNEVDAYLRDLETIEDGGAAFRFVSGRYGSGKSFLLQLIRNNAMDRNFVVMDADLSPERRFSGTKGQGLATYRELMQNLSTKTFPDGKALDSILQKWINDIRTEIMREKNLGIDDPELINLVSRRITDDLAGVREMTCGFAFATVVNDYWRGMAEQNDELKQAALRWLRGEYSTKTEAKRELRSVDTIINDNNWYDFLKLFALFVHMAGYQGLLIFIDEGVNLYKIVNKVARNNNYEKVLTMFNDMQQGKANYIGMTLAGTPEFISDERKGLYSYEALRSRLADTRLSGSFTDYAAPVLKLQPLSHEELYVLLERLCEIHGAHYKYEPNFTEKQLTDFLEALFSRIGAEELTTTREVSREFLTLLNLLYQHPEADFYEQLKIIRSSEVEEPEESDTVSEEDQRILDETDAIFEEFDI